MIAIDVVSDVICPWCFLGKRRLDKAVAALDGIETEINWRPYQLDPSIPKQGIDRSEYLTRKFGAARLATLHDPLVEASKADGVPYRFDRITRTPNTLDAHRLIRWAHVSGRQHDMAERLFMAYWHDGLDIGDKDVLLKLAVDAGLDGTLVSQLLHNEADLDAVIAEINQAQRMGISGVPTFIIAGRYGVTGAQSPDVLKGAILKAAAAA